MADIQSLQRYFDVSNNKVLDYNVGDYVYRISHPIRTRNCKDIESQYKLIGYVLKLDSFKTSLLSEGKDLLLASVSIIDNKIVIYRDDSRLYCKILSSQKIPKMLKEFVEDIPSPIVVGKLARSRKNFMLSQQKILSPLIVMNIDDDNIILAGETIDGYIKEISTNIYGLSGID